MNNKSLIFESSLLAPVPIPSGFKSNFGEKRDYETHPGMDIPVPVGTKVLAPMDGIVKIANMNYNNLCGGTIDIDYGNGFTSRFCHMSKIDVREGDRVTQSQVVGLSGGVPGAPGAGRTTGPHLHFTLTKDGSNVDPIKYINAAVPDSKEISDVNKVAQKISAPVNFADMVKDLKPGALGDALSKGIQSIFKEEVERIKQLMK